MTKKDDQSVITVPRVLLHALLVKASTAFTTDDVDVRAARALLETVDDIDPRTIHEY